MERIEGRKKKGICFSCLSIFLCFVVVFPFFVV